MPYPYREAEFKNGFIYLNIERSEELEAEGYAREIMRRVQALRKRAGLQKKDRVSLFIKADEELTAMLTKWNSTIKDKVGAEHIRISELDPAKEHSFSSKEKIRGKTVELFFNKV